MIDSINELLIKVGAQLVAYRSTFFQRLLERMGPLYSKITGSSEELTGSYTPSWILEDDQQNEVLDSQTPKKIEITKEEAIFQLSDSLKRLQSREISINRTLIGPHRDHIDLFINGMNSSIFAESRAQRSDCTCVEVSGSSTDEV